VGHFLTNTNLSDATSGHNSWGKLSKEISNVDMILGIIVLIIIVTRLVMITVPICDRLRIVTTPILVRFGMITIIKGGGYPQGYVVEDRRVPYAMERSEAHFTSNFFL
jgi:hypothetical protein